MFSPSPQAMPAGNQHSMRRFTHTFRRALIPAPILLALAFTTGCGTTPDQSPPRIGAGDDANEKTGAAGVMQDRGFRDSAYADLFADAEAALDNGDWMSAQLAIPRAAGTIDHEFASYERYIRARIAWQRGDTEAMADTLDGLPDAVVSDALAVKILQLQRRRAWLKRRYLASARLSIQTLDHLPGDHPDAASVASEAWRALQRVADSELRRAADSSRVDSETGWFLAALLPRSADRVATWRGRYPGHPAERFLSATVGTPAPHRVALLLPLGGRIADAAAAVRDGFIRHYYEQRAAGAITWDLIVLDTGDHDSIRDAYNAAIDSGAQLVVGPLTKAAVGELLTPGSLAVPVIALNRLEREGAGIDNSLQFALAPEDEAAQVARLAFADGHRRALLVRPAGEWGARMETALTESWLQLGGQIAASATFSGRETHSSSLSAALDLDASRQRAAELRRQLAQSIEITGRRRGDIDSVFLLAPGAAEARSLKPLLAYHYAGSLPAYATSSANSDENRGEETDLNGLRLVEMPRILDGGNNNTPLRGQRYERLVALGADACRLATLGLVSHSRQGPLLQGETGFLSINGQGQIERDLQPAVFDRGVLRRR